MNCLKNSLSSACLVATFFAGWSVLTAAPAETIVHDNDRIVFCGDSITGQGGRGATTWVGLIKEGLAITHPKGNQTLTALGGSGSTVAAWQNFEKKSRYNSVFLDIPGVDVKATLDGGADILVIMLGMNDLTSPAVKDSPTDFDAWAARYHDLIESLKARAHPRVVALGTITPYTEDNNSPKNRVEGELNTRLAALAKQENAVVLPTHEAMMELLAAGRSFRPDFHVTGDFVHPNGVGHLAIAVGMLRGMGEADAAARILDKYSKLFHPAATDLPALSYALSTQPTSPDEARHHFTIHFQWTPPAASAATPPTVIATAPEGWEVVPARLTGTAGDFQVSGPLDRLVNKVTLTATAGALKKQTEIPIPAGWRVAIGKGKGLGWAATGTYDPTKDILPLDQELSQDEAFAKPVNFPVGGSCPWQHYIASFNFTGHAEPGSIDMAAITFYTSKDLAYGVRWIYSDKERPVDVILGSQALAGKMFAESIRLNDDLLYEGRIGVEPGLKKTVEGKLHHGWNRLLFRSTFLQWQWQFSINLAAKPGDDLADLRYATVPPPHQ